MNLHNQFVTNLTLNEDMDRHRRQPGSEVKLTFSGSILLTACTETEKMALANGRISSSFRAPMDF